MKDIPHPDEFNPNHPVVKAAHDNWHKIAAFIMWKLRVKVLSFSIADIDAMAKEDMVIVLHDHNDSLEVKLMPRLEGEKLAREHGGMPA